MKINPIIAMMFAASLSVLGACSGGKSEAPVLITDEMGVVQKIDPQQKNVFLVFTGHYSMNDSGRFENFMG